VIKNKINLRRAVSIQGFLSANDIGTDALNAITAIPGVENPQIIADTGAIISIEYEWHGEERFMKTDEHLAKFGLERIVEEVQ